MIVAISRFAVKNGKEAEVRAAFETRPRHVEAAPGFLGMEVLQEGATFVLATRWCDERSFRSWHDGPAHHASHPAIPAGLRLDPSVTQLVVGARIDAATSETADGNLVSDLSVPIARLARDGATLHLAVIDGDGRIVRANAAFAHSAGGDPIGRMLASLLTPASGELLDANVARGERSAFTIQLTPAKADPVSLRVFVQPRVPGFALVGEPPWEDHRALEAQLISLNAELAILSRERVRQARLLEKANHDLQESHWHLKKVSEVLPMCMACREVKTGPDSWEDVAAFLMRSSDFLSHGYCARCAEKIAHDVEGGP